MISAPSRLWWGCCPRPERAKWEPAGKRRRSHFDNGRTQEAAMDMTRIVLVAVISAAPMATALAADMITVPTSSRVELPVHDQAGFDWSGFYAGVYAGVQDSAAGGTQFGAGVNAGVNAQFDFYLLGAEVAVHGLTDAGAGETSYGQILGRA